MIPVPKANNIALQAFTMAAAKGQFDDDISEELVFGRCS